MDKRIKKKRDYLYSFDYKLVTLALFLALNGAITEKVLVIRCK